MYRRNYRSLLSVRLSPTVFEDGVLECLVAALKLWCTAETVALFFQAVCPQGRGWRS